ncbi:MAG TPA: GH92 family glycosyl hydrolase [Acidisarcina sp.]|nr:GH92 family glycosyl hydrolase [Acidisarcina sp.]
MAVLGVCCFNAAAMAQVAQYVDPMLGVDGGGNTFPGPTMPFGMAKPGPDMGGRGNGANAGWAAEGEILGFSQTHVSGTGGGAKYGNILIQPTIGKPVASGYESSREREESSIGFYRVTLKKYPVDVEITATRHTSLYRLTYPETRQANILFDAGHCLSSGRKSGEGQAITASQVTVVSSTEVTGQSSVTGGWNKQPNSYTVYFYAKSDTPARSWGTWRDKDLHPGVRRAEAGANSGTGAWLTFPTTKGQQVRLKVGISFVSKEQAKRNATIEVAGFDFEATRASAVAEWNQVLGAIELQGETPAQAQMFYTALYHTMLMPVDRTGENPLWQSTEPYYDDYYAIWDTFRTSSPLLTLIAPERETRIVRALVDLYRHERWLPDARSGNYNGRTQGGSNAEFVLTDAYLKGLKGIDWNTAYAAEVKDAEVSPADQLKEGRGGLAGWRDLGYVTLEEVDRPGSKQMEYAANDYEIALLAKGLGKTTDYAKYLKRSGNWENLWDSHFEDGGFQGFIRPRHRDGSWLTPFTAIEGCSWGGKTFYEGNSWTYSLFVPQNVARLIEKSGGAQRFVNRLDAFFTVPGPYDVGNEPGFLSPYLYIWAGRHDKAAERVREILAVSFHAGRKGLPGNDDSGAMSSWYAFGLIGIFPNAGQDVYLIGSPSLPQTTLHLADDKRFVIETKNVSATNKYVTAAELNGEPLNRAWLRHAEIAGGGRLVLTMSAAPGTWPTGELPPSAPAIH